MTAPSIPLEYPRTIFASRRARLLHALTVLLGAQLAGVVWLLSLAPREEWLSSPLGPRFWWLIPGVLVGLSCVLPATMVWLNGRYVLRLDVDHETARATLFTLWGTRIRTIARQRLASGRLDSIFSESAAPAWRLRVPAERVDWLFDLQGDFPHGEEPVIALTRPPARG